VLTRDEVVALRRERSAAARERTLARDRDQERDRAVDRLERREVRRRVARVRAAKRAKERAGEVPVLTESELAEVLP
jgi:hypothetical protein